MARLRFVPQWLPLLLPVALTGCWFSGVSPCAPEYLPAFVTVGIKAHLTRIIKHDPRLITTHGGGVNILLPVFHNQKPVSQDSGDRGFGIFRGTSMNALVYLRRPVALTLKPRMHAKANCCHGSSSMGLPRIAPLRAGTPWKRQ